MRFIRKVKKKTFFHPFCFRGVFSRYFKRHKERDNRFCGYFFDSVLLYFIRQKIAQTIGLYGGYESCFERFVCGE